MPYAFNLTLDPDTSLEIERYYSRLAGHGIADEDVVSHYGPCVTLLVVADSVHLDDVRQMLDRRVRKASALAVRFTEPCIIIGNPATLSLRVTPTDGLLALHHALYSELPVQAVHLHYRPAHWQPHLKLANVRGNQAANTALVKAMAKDWQLMDARLEGLEVMQYPPVEAIWQAPLKT